MKIHEYQAKQLFSNYNIPIPEEFVCHTPDEVKTFVSQINETVVVKAQVHAGGRGKAGGVKLAHNADEAYHAANSILGMEIKGLTVHKVLVAKAVKFIKEYYLSVTVDRNCKKVIFIASREGGVEIEEVAANNPELIFTIPIDSTIGMLNFSAQQIAFKLFDNIDHVRQASSIIKNIYCLMLEKDASLVEINPLVLTEDDKVIALDGKMNFDENALYRNPDIEALADLTDDEKLEKDAKEKGLSYIKLDGEIGCMVNGAGLAMATMDMIKLYGGDPANFLDIGGSSNPQKVIHAMEFLLSDKNVKVVMINIFGGITRCDDVAKGLIEAFKQIEVNVPIVVRLSGTNAQEGLQILKDTDLITVNSMSDAAKKAIELCNKISPIHS